MIVVADLYWQTYFDHVCLVLLTSAALYLFSSLQASQTQMRVADRWGLWWVAELLIALGVAEGLKLATWTGLLYAEKWGGCVDDADYTLCIT